MGEVISSKKTSSIDKGRLSAAKTPHQLTRGGYQQQKNIIKTDSGSLVEKEGLERGREGELLDPVEAVRSELLTDAAAADVRQR